MCLFIHEDCFMETFWPWPAQAVRSYHKLPDQDGKSTFRVPNHLELMKKVGLSLGAFCSMAMIQPGSSHHDVLHMQYHLLYNNSVMYVYIYICIDTLTI